MGGMKTPLVWLSVPLFAACAANAPVWQKSGASESASAEDFQQCRVEARLTPGASVGATPTPQTSGSPMLDREQERDAEEAQRVRRCMEGKGYSLKR